MESWGANSVRMKGPKLCSLGLKCLWQSFVPDHIMPGAQRLKAGGEGDNRGWDEIDWMASPARWT